MVIPPNNIGKGSSGAAHSAQTGNVQSRPSPTASEGARKPADSTSAESVSLSAEAQKMANLEAAANKHSGVDESRVATIRDAINNGQYSIDSHSLAHKILDMDGKF